jgi:Concanavalin A-like lectin/glucanases superfamily
MAALSSARQNARVAADKASESAIQNALGVDLSGQWDFEDGSGTTLTDLSGSGHNGTIIGATWTTGINGNELSFDGSTNYVSVANYTLPKDVGTLTFWIKPTWNGTDGVSHIIVDCASGGPFWVGKTYANMLMVMWNNGAGQATWAQVSASQLQRGQWNFVAVQWDDLAPLQNGHYSNIILNNVQATSFRDDNVSRNYPTAPLYFAKQGASSGNGEIGTAQWYGGVMDEVHVYASVLTQADIQKIYAEEAPEHDVALL